METRNRGRRVPNGPHPASQPEPGRGARRTRQFASPGPPPSEPGRWESRRSTPRTPQETPSFLRGLAADQIPRRGARPSGRAKSIASIATDPPRLEDDTEYDDDDNGDDDEDTPRPGDIWVTADRDATPESLFVTDDYVEQESREAATDGVKDSSVKEEELEDVNEDEAAKLKVLDLSLPDLAKAADDLIAFLSQPNFDPSSKVHSRLLGIKQRTLNSIREEFEEDQMAPFVDWAPMIKLYQAGSEAEIAAEIIARTNVATAYTEICAIQANGNLDPFPFIQKLYEIELELFITSSDMRQDRQLMLDIRTQYLLDVLPAQNEVVDPFDFLADVFCEPSEASNFDRFVRGPFKRLAVGERRGENNDLCTKRILEIVRVFKKHKKNWKRKEYGVDELKQKFPLNNLFENFKAWLFDTHRALAKSETATRRAIPAERGVLPNIEEVSDDTQTDMAESQTQSIIRPDTGEEIPSLFHNETSVRFLQNQRLETPLAEPPSNQQQVMAPPGAPRDYPEHTNEELLADTPPRPLSVMSSSKSQPAARASRKRKVPSSDVEDADAEEEDPFETDTRPLDKGKQAAVSARRPAAKRSRLEMRPPSSLPIRSPPSTRVPQTQDDAAPSASQYSSIENLKVAKQAMIYRAKAAANANSTGIKQRFVWSDHDTDLLLRLIAQRQAAWSAIERLDNHLFERPRNQQAYRDKARNMKVDYLITDAILPPCFDLVALSRKEVARLIKMGKNPARKEADVDDNGNAIGTEFDEESYEAAFVSQHGA